MHIPLHQPGMEGLDGSSQAHMQRGVALANSEPSGKIKVRKQKRNGKKKILVKTKYEI